MKTITGKLESVQPISLSKASRYISDFASFENNGASEVVSIYLNRASKAFSSLVQLHKELKHPQSSHKSRKKSLHGKENATGFRNDKTTNYDDGERKNRIRNENQGELEDRRVGVTEEDMSVRGVSGIEDMETSKKKRKEKHKKERVKIDDSISSELRKGSNNGGNVEVDNMVNGSVDQTKKSKKKKHDKTREVSKMKDSVDVKIGGGENGSGLGIEKKGKDDEKDMMERKENEIKGVEKEGAMDVEQEKKNKKKKREQNQIKEMRSEGKLDVGQERESKKKKR